MLAACTKEQNEFVTVADGIFFQGTKPYKYIGCNYWYGGYIAHDTSRVKNELDFLKQQGISNLRVFLCGEGDQQYPYRIYPSLQQKPAAYDETLLQGFDIFLSEVAKRNMQVVFVLNNNWEWSGGFGQYLEWSGKGKPPLPKTADWDWNAYCHYIAQFYSCQECIALSNNWIRHVVSRTNTVNGVAYKDDTHIMAWELANEPRPMDSAATENYIRWTAETASLIKSLDKNHLVTIGTEGVISTFYNETIYEQIHANPHIDYFTLHLWPKTWLWYNGDDAAAVRDTTLVKTKNYIEQHSRIAASLKKPLVIEEFGLHRDKNSFSPLVDTKNRNAYYKYVFEIGNANAVSGYNFWGYAGLEENFNAKGFMQKGMEYSADPPQEEQGLYAVYKTDSSTWSVIRNGLLLLK